MKSPTEITFELGNRTQGITCDHNRELKNHDDDFVDDDRK